MDTLIHALQLHSKGKYKIETQKKFMCIVLERMKNNKKKIYFDVRLSRLDVENT